MTQPGADELEISVFGVGIGESVVAHLGDGEWVVIDSCRVKGSSVSVAEWYLDSLGVDIATQVKLVLVTHWHNDHIRGAASLLKRATSAKFACTTALRHKEFSQLIAVASKRPGRKDLSEFLKILDVLKTRSSKSSSIGPDIWAVEGMTLFRKAGAIQCELHAVSPSSTAVTSTFGQLYNVSLATGDLKKQFRSISPNVGSVATVIVTDSVNVLLGADLELTDDERLGWKAVVNSNQRPQVKCHLYKVAHHGSITGDNEEIWSKLLNRLPVGVLTSNSGGKKKLPTEEDIKRVKTHCSDLYSTNISPEKRTERRDSVDKSMDEAAVSRRRIVYDLGQVQVRCRPSTGAALDVKLMGEARLI